MTLKIAVSKGRVYEDFLSLLKSSGYRFKDEKTRKLVIKDLDNSINLIIVKAIDVPLYVNNAFADLGIVGKDIIDEFDDLFYELLNLEIGVCDLCIASMKNSEIKEMNYLKIATKYPKQANEYLKYKNLNGEVIKLNGSVELGPLINISDCILDIVETGNTLKENGLEVNEHFKKIYSKVIANKVSYKTKTDIITEFINKISW